jgi:hypothetical protein
MPKINKAKNLSAGVSKTKKKAPMVDPKGAYTKVQERTLGNMKNGGVKKAQTGISQAQAKSSLQSSADSLRKSAATYMKKGGKVVSKKK